MIQQIKPYDFNKTIIPLSYENRQFGVLSKLLKLDKIITAEDIQDVLQHKKSFFDTNFEYFYDELNEIINGNMPPRMKNQIDIFRRETGIELHVDNNLDDKKFGYALNALYLFYDTNKLKGYEMPKDIYITRFMENNLGGLYDGENETMYLYPSYPENYKSFFKNLHHENMHHRDRNRLTQGVNYFYNHSSKKEKESVIKVLRPYAISTRSEFCACLAEKIENEELFVVQNSDGDTFLRKYKDPNDKTEKKDLEVVAKLYRKFKCPQFVPAKAPKLHTPYIEVPLD